tara:strand:+ start:2282 stop:3286 length:1005 start_codon:yes stop_codon:yes gene_type:complete
MIAHVTLLAGCGWLGLRDKSGDYLLSEETVKTEIPEDMAISKSLEQLYPIPGISRSNEANLSFELPRPLPASENTFDQLVKIQSFDENRWILINIPPNETWPRLRNVLNRSGVPTDAVDGFAGRIDTVWVTFKSDEIKSHRFKFDITPGVQLDSTEIRITHNEADRGSELEAEWPEKSDSDQRELDMLTLIANDLASLQDFASVSMLANEIGGVSKVTVVNSTEYPFIEMKLGFARAWASVIYSSERGGFTTLDRDRSEGLIYVNYSEDGDTERGFFSRIFTREKDPTELEIQYLIDVSQVDDSIRVRVFNKDNAQIERTSALRILSALRTNLS